MKQSFGLLICFIALSACVKTIDITEPQSPIADTDEGDIEIVDHKYWDLPYTDSMKDKIRRYLVDNPGHHFFLSTKPSFAGNVRSEIIVGGASAQMQKLILGSDPFNSTNLTLWVHTVPFSSICNPEIQYHYRVTYRKIFSSTDSVRNLGSATSPLETSIRGYGGLLMYSVGDVNPPPDQWVENLNAWKVPPFSAASVSYAGMYSFSDIPDGGDSINMITSHQLFERDFYLVNLDPLKEFSVLSLVGNTAAPMVIVTFPDGTQQSFPNRGDRFTITEVSNLPSKMGCGETTVFKIRYTRPFTDNDYSRDYARIDIPLREEGLPEGTYNARHMYFIVLGVAPINPP